MLLGRDGRVAPPLQAAAGTANQRQLFKASGAMPAQNPHCKHGGVLVVCTVPVHCTLQRAEVYNA